MAKKVFLFAIIACFASVNADALFYTDFCTTPAGFAESSAKATAKGADDTLVVNPSGASAPKDTVIDGCTISAYYSSSGERVVTLSKASQSFVKFGDTAGCTPGRLSLKNTGSSITMPEVTGPCTITYYGAGSSASAGRGFQCLVNDISTPEAGISELLLEEQQATRKIVYSCPTEGPVVFKLIAQGSVYLYDVKVESGTAGVVQGRTVSKNYSPLWTKDNLIINTDRARVEIFTLAGERIMTSDLQMIPISSISKGLYLARIAGTNERLKIVK
ncbi:MAG: T9SS type A sorting domain-containing protein [Chitinispirillaceae bacterium]|nr:T9SS type A sorting domain-containing protein [Chitinispirillaceae bacterium]